MTWLEAIIIAFIVLGIGWTVWRGGQANPEGTGALGQKVSDLSGRVGHVESELADLKSEAATTKDIERLEQMAERTYRSVDRIERILIERSLDK